MENTGYILLAIVAVIWFAGMLFGMIAIFPAGIIGFLALGGVVFLFAKVIKERLTNKEDDYYSKNVTK